MAEDKKKKKTGQQAELMRVLDVTPDDLMANDQGIITEAQRQTFVANQQYRWKQSQQVLIPFSLAALVMIVFSFLIPDGVGLSILGSIFAVLGAVAYLDIARKKGLIANELSRNQLETVQGVAVVNRTETTSLLEINGLKLHTSPDVLNRVRHLEPYVVHYLPQSNLILSMEHIAEDSNIRTDEATSRLVDDVIVDDQSQENTSSDNQKYLSS